MCSNESSVDLTARLSSAIDDVAAAADAAAQDGAQRAGEELTARLAAAWALIAAADPKLADRTARY